MFSNQWRRAKSLLRQALYQAASSSGFNHLVAKSRWRRKRLLILCYHGFSRADEHQWDPELYITPETFRTRLQILREAGAAVLPLGAALKALAAGNLPDMAVSITVDDGAVDFQLVAYPILQEYRVPVTVYVTSYYVLNRLPVFDVCARYLLWRARDSGRTLNGAPWPLEPLILDGGDAWYHAGLRLREYADRCRLSAADKQTLLGELAVALGVDLGQLQRQEFFYLMTPEHLATLDPSVVDVQLHTHRHTMPEDPPSLRREIAANREALEQCGRSAPGLVHFCYPSGVYRRDALPVLRSAGIVSATTCVPGLASQASERLLLPRFVDNERVSDAAFRAWVSGAGPWLGRQSAP
jgi:peptidoglycan/xylan/chitin deacetylase (PgdA/CDA1 family)